MAYVSADVGVISAGLIESNQSIWLYRNSAGDSEATIKGASFFADGASKGMKVGDIVWCFNLGGTAANSAILAVASLAAPAATVAASVVVT